MIRGILGVILVSFLCVTDGVGAAAAHRKVSVLHGSARGWIDARVNPRHPWLFVGAYYDNVVTIYDLGRFGSPKIGEITDGIDQPGGLGIDADGTLYVANRAGSVTVYPAGQVSPSLTLTQGLQTPVAVAPDSLGNLYVTNRGSNPSIEIYAPGQNVPSRSITGSLIQNPTEIAFDASSDLFFSDSITGVSEIPAGSQVPQSLGLGGIIFTSGFALDPATGEMFVSQAGDGNVLVFEPGSTAPSRSLPGTPDCDLLTVGRVKGTDYVFVPHTRNDDVASYRMRGQKVRVSIPTGSFNLGVAFKPAGIP